jgi:ribosomal protein S18 acetylase RimI-like enzyme
VTAGELRVATRADLGDLLEAERTSFPGGPQDAWLLAPLIMDQGAWLYRAPEELLGYALVMARMSHPGVAFLFSFAVLPEARGRGVGRAFFRALTEELAARGFRELELYVAPENVAALRIYEGAGLARAGLHEGLFGPGEDRLELRGPLRPA